MGTSIGATMAWWLAAKHSDRVSTLVCINIPHPGALAAGRPKTQKKAKGQKGARKGSEGFEGTKDKGRKGSAKDDGTKGKQQVLLPKGFGKGTKK